MNGRVNEQVRTIFAEALNITVPADDVDLIDGGLLDWLALVELIMELEHRFGISIPFDTLDIDDFRSVESIGAIVAANEGRRERVDQAARAGDLDDVARLYEVVARSGSRVAPPGSRPTSPRRCSTIRGPIRRYLRSSARTTTGRSSVSSRRMSSGCTSPGDPFASGAPATSSREPDAHNRAIGLFLMRHYMNGAQELTFMTRPASPSGGCGNPWEARPPSSIASAG